MSNIFQYGGSEADSRVSNRHLLSQASKMRGIDANNKFICFFGGCDRPDLGDDWRIAYFISHLRDAANEAKGAGPYMCCDIVHHMGPSETIVIPQGNHSQVVQASPLFVYWVGNIRFPKLPDTMNPVISRELYIEWVQFFCDLKNNIGGKSLSEKAINFIRDLGQRSLNERDAEYNFSVEVVKTFVSSLQTIDKKEIRFEVNEWGNIHSGFYILSEQISEVLFGPDQLKRTIQISYMVNNSTSVVRRKYYNNQRGGANPGRNVVVYGKTEEWGIKFVELHQTIIDAKRFLQAQVQLANPLLIAKTDIIYETINNLLNITLPKSALVILINSLKKDEINLNYDDGYSDNHEILPHLTVGFQTPGVPGAPGANGLDMYIKELLTYLKLKIPANIITITNPQRVLALINIMDNILLKVRDSYNNYMDILYTDLKPANALLLPPNPAKIDANNVLQNVAAAAAPGVAAAAAPGVAVAAPGVAAAAAAPGAAGAIPPKPNINPHIAAMGALLLNQPGGPAAAAANGAPAAAAAAAANAGAPGVGVGAAPPAAPGVGVGAGAAHPPPAAAVVVAGVGVGAAAAGAPGVGVGAAPPAAPGDGVGADPGVAAPAAGVGAAPGAGAAAQALVNQALNAAPGAGAAAQALINQALHAAAQALAPGAAAQVQAGKVKLITSITELLQEINKLENNLKTAEDKAARAQKSASAAKIGSPQQAQADQNYAQATLEVDQIRLKLNRLNTDYTQKLAELNIKFGNHYAFPPGVPQVSVAQLQNGLASAQAQLINNNGQIIHPTTVVGSANTSTPEVGVEDPKVMFDSLKNCSSTVSSERYFKAATLQEFFKKLLKHILAETKKTVEEKVNEQEEETAYEPSKLNKITHPNTDTGKKYSYIRENGVLFVINNSTNVRMRAEDSVKTRDDFCAAVGFKNGDCDSFFRVCLAGTDPEGCKYFLKSADFWIKEVDQFKNNVNLFAAYKALLKYGFKTKFSSKLNITTLETVDEWLDKIKSKTPGDHASISSNDALLTLLRITVEETNKNTVILNSNESNQITANEQTANSQNIVAERYLKKSSNSTKLTVAKIIGANAANTSKMQTEVARVFATLKRNLQTAEGALERIKPDATKNKYNSIQMTGGGDWTKNLTSVQKSAFENSNINHHQYYETIKTLRSSIDNLDMGGISTNYSHIINLFKNTLSSANKTLDPSHESLITKALDQMKNDEKSFLSIALYAHKFIVYFYSDITPILLQWSSGNKNDETDDNTIHSIINHTQMNIDELKTVIDLAEKKLNKYCSANGKPAKVANICKQLALLTDASEFTQSDHNTLGSRDNNK